MPRIWPAQEGKNLAMSALNDRLWKAEQQLRQLAKGWYLNIHLDFEADTVLVALTEAVEAMLFMPQHIRFTEPLCGFPSEKLITQIMLVAK